ncbi:MaoC family dehydratase [Paralcaligenes ureilyticus]|uniref:Acyl dehydratase n=1 Tax=Paralcaligenes ureilyticus TaxID=627131 RepID=A0A4R3M769_9BURK|nr:MaoC family dehydratase [Paralcaligenes ureilyticus]TCT07135.1 acyl dehydratase [Paralcaligenes ureilyticus]
MDTNGIDDVQVGASSRISKTLSEADVYMYAGISGDFSPNHIDEVYMKAGRYGQRIAHGTLLMGFMSAASARLYLGRTVSLGYDRVRFTAPVFFGDTITTEYTIKQIDRDKRRIYADVCCTNQHGQVVGAALNIRAFVG